MCRCFKGEGASKWERKESVSLSLRFLFLSRGRRAGGRRGCDAAGGRFLLPGSRDGNGLPRARGNARPPKKIFF